MKRAQLLRQSKLPTEHSVGTGEEVVPAAAVKELAAELVKAKHEATTEKIKWAKSLREGINLRNELNYVKKELSDTLEWVDSSEELRKKQVNYLISEWEVERHAKPAVDPEPVEVPEPVVVHVPEPAPVVAPPEKKNSKKKIGLSKRLQQLSKPKNPPRKETKETGK